MIRRDIFSLRHRRLLAAFVCVLAIPAGAADEPKGMVIAELELRGKSLGEIATALNEAVKGSGLEVKYLPAPGMKDQPSPTSELDFLSLNMPVTEVAKTICEAIEGAWRLKGNAVQISESALAWEPPVTRDFQVEPQFAASVEKVTGEKRPDGAALLRFFEGLTCALPIGSAVSFNPRLQRLTVSSNAAGADSLARCLDGFRFIDHRARLRTRAWLVSAKSAEARRRLRWPHGSQADADEYETDQVRLQRLLNHPGIQILLNHEILAGPGKKARSLAKLGKAVSELEVKATTEHGNPHVSLALEWRFILGEESATLAEPLSVTSGAFHVLAVPSLPTPSAGVPDFLVVQTVVEDRRAPQYDDAYSVPGEAEGPMKEVLDLELPTLSHENQPIGDVLRQLAATTRELTGQDLPLALAIERARKQKVVAAEPDDFKGDELDEFDEFDGPGKPERPVSGSSPRLGGLARRVTMEFSNIPVGDAIRYLLREPRLTYAVEESGIIIGEEGRLPRRYHTDFHDVGSDVLEHCPARDDPEAADEGDSAMALYEETPDVASIFRSDLAFARLYRQLGVLAVRGTKKELLRCRRDLLELADSHLPWSQTAVRADCWLVALEDPELQRGLRSKDRPAYEVYLQQLLGQEQTRPGVKVLLHGEVRSEIGQAARAQVQTGKRSSHLIMTPALRGEGDIDIKLDWAWRLPEPRRPGSWRTQRLQTTIRPWHGAPVVLLYPGADQTDRVLLISAREGYYTYWQQQEPESTLAELLRAARGDVGASLDRYGGWYGYEDAFEQAQRIIIDQIDAERADPIDLVRLLAEHSKARAPEHWFDSWIVPGHFSWAPLLVRRDGSVTTDVGGGDPANNNLDRMAQFFRGRWITLHLRQPRFFDACEAMSLYYRYRPTAQFIPLALADTGCFPVYAVDASPTATEMLRRVFRPCNNSDDAPGDPTHGEGKIDPESFFGIQDWCSMRYEPRTQYVVVSFPKHALRQLWQFLQHGAWRDDRARLGVHWPERVEVTGAMGADIAYSDTVEADGGRFGRRIDARADPITPDISALTYTVATTGAGARTERGRVYMRHGDASATPSQAPPFQFDLGLVPPLSPWFDSAADRRRSGQDDPGPRILARRRMLARLTIPRIRFDGLTLRQCIDVLRFTCEKAQFPPEAGNFVLALPPEEERAKETTAPKLAATLEQRSVRQIVEYLCRHFKVEYRTRPGFVLLGESLDRLFEYVAFPIPPTEFGLDPTKPKPVMTRDELLPFMRQHAIPITDGDRFFYDAQAGLLHVIGGEAVLVALDRFATAVKPRVWQITLDGEWAAAKGDEQESFRLYAVPGAEAGVSFGAARQLTFLPEMKGDALSLLLRWEDAAGKGEKRLADPHQTGAIAVQLSRAAPRLRLKVKLLDVAGKGQ